MDVGAHLPLADFGDGTPTVDGLRDYVRTARDLGYAAVSANDHLVWRRPWLDGPTALAAVAGHAGEMALATSIALPVVRHPVVVAKTLSSLAALTGSRVIGGLGPGSSQGDYDAVGVPFAERWARFDESMSVVRTLVRGEATTGGTLLRTRRDRSLRCASRHRRCGSAAGAPTVASRVWPRSRTDGSRRRTTPHPRSTPPPGPGSTGISWRAGRDPARLPRRRSPRPGRWSPTSPANATGCCTTCSDRCSVATPRRSATCRRVAGPVRRGAGGVRRGRAPVILVWPLHDARAQLELLAEARPR